MTFAFATVPQSFISPSTLHLFIPKTTTALTMPIRRLTTSPPPFRRGLTTPPPPFLISCRKAPRDNTRRSYVNSRRAYAVSGDERDRKLARSARRKMNLGNRKINLKGVSPNVEESNDESEPEDPGPKSEEESEESKSTLRLFIPKTVITITITAPPPPFPISCRKAPRDNTRRSYVQSRKTYAVSGDERDRKLARAARRKLNLGNRKIKSEEESEANNDSK